MSQTWEIEIFEVPKNLPYLTSERICMTVISFDHGKRNDDYWVFCVAPIHSSTYTSRDVLFTHDEEPPGDMINVGTFSDDQFGPEKIFVHLGKTQG